MNAQLRNGQQVVNYDCVQTVRLYANAITAAGADECTCVNCKNFAAQRTKGYPETFLALLNQVGVDPMKELEAFDYDFGVEKAGHLYGGWFVFCGQLVEGIDWRPERRSGLFTYWFTNSFPSSQLPNVSLCAIEFCVELPWVIPESDSAPHR